MALQQQNEADNIRDLSIIELLEQKLVKEDWEYIYFAVEDRFIKELNTEPPETVVRILTFLKAKSGS